MTTGVKTIGLLSGCGGIGGGMSLRLVTGVRLELRVDCKSTRCHNYRRPRRIERKAFQIVSLDLSFSLKVESFSGHLTTQRMNG